jgi:hypothetical protein
VSTFGRNPCAAPTGLGGRCESGPTASAVGYDLSSLAGLLIHARQFEGVDLAGRGMDFGAR